jgi:hypothetical protein
VVAVEQVADVEEHKVVATVVEIEVVDKADAAEVVAEPVVDAEVAVQKK